MNKTITITRSLALRPERGEEGKIIVVKGARVGKHYPVRPWEKILIGRDETQCDIVIPTNTVTRVHCEVYYDPGRKMYVVTDMSKNGIILNNEFLLPKNKECDVAPGSTLMIGSTQDIIVLDHPDDHTA